MTEPNRPSRRREDVMGQPTLRELERRMDELQDRVDRRFDSLAAQVATLKYVTIDRYDAEQRSLEQRITKLEQSNIWLSRTIVAILISAIVTAVTAVVMARGGV
jgi:hypothetical protein